MSPFLAQSGPRLGVARLLLAPVIMAFSLSLVAARAPRARAQDVPTTDPVLSAAMSQTDDALRQTSMAATQAG